MKESNSKHVSRKYFLAELIRQEMDETSGITVTVLRSRLIELLDIIEAKREE